MRPNNVIRSIEDLRARTETLLSILKSRYHGLGSFLSDQDFTDYWKYYKELMPFLQQFASESGDEMVLQYVDIYSRANVERIERSIGQKRSVFQVLIQWSNPSLPYQNSEEFEFALKDIIDNLSNLIYQIKVMTE